MTNRRLWLCLLLVAGSAASLPRQVPTVRGASTTGVGWNPQTAAAYLDSRETWWQAWPNAKRDHGTICISCHTTVLYAMVRPALRTALHESAVPQQETVLLENVERRVSEWGEMLPFYSDAVYGKGKAAESHSTEAVLNATLLTSRDNGTGALRPVTRTALASVWALQIQSGANAGGWIWQDFHLAPWESGDSAYQGAALLMLALSHAPSEYAQEPGVGDHIALLKDYLRRGYDSQPRLNQIYTLWASGSTPGLLTAVQQSTQRRELLGLQRPDDGWRSSSLSSWLRVDKTEQPTDSDGYATALVVLALQADGEHSDATIRGLAWLRQHQQADGHWSAASLNKQRDPASNIGLFMSDAATAYAVLALEDMR